MFRLRNLTFATSSTSAALNHALLSSSASSLLSLTLKFTLPNDRSALISSLPLVANSLQSLTIADPIPGLGPVLSNFSSLYSLTLHVIHFSQLPNYDSFLAPLTRSIDSIKLSVTNFGDDPSLRALTQSLRGAAGRKVTEVKIRTLGRILEESPWCKELTEVCSERGIRVACK